MLLPRRQASKTNSAWLQEKPILVKAVLARSRKRKLTTAKSKRTNMNIKSILTGA